jgi:hypothetical protein
VHELLWSWRRALQDTPAKRASDDPAVRIMRSG